jgi:hypothetical protein
LVIGSSFFVLRSFVRSFVRSLVRGAGTTNQNDEPRTKN